MPVPTKPLSPEDVATLKDGIARYGMLVFHDQKLTDEQQMAFSRNSRGASDRSA